MPSLLNCTTATLVEDFLAPYTTSPISPKLMPRIIHQVWFSSNRAPIPEEWQISAANWQRFHPTYAYVLWNAELALDFIQSFFPEYSEVYTELPHEIQRIDFIRYCFLLRYGGVYADLDMEPTRSITDLMETECQVSLITSHTRNSSHNYANSLMMSHKNISFWRDVLRICCRQPEWWIRGKHLRTIFVTGPMALTQAVSEYSGYIRRLPRSAFNPRLGEAGNENSYIKALPGSSWHSWDSKVFSLLMDHRATCVTIGVIVLFILCYFAWRGMWL